MFTWFWNPTFWLPPNINWVDIENLEVNDKYPQTKDLYSTVFITIIIIATRILFEKYVSIPLGRYCLASPSPPTNLFIPSKNLKTFHEPPKSRLSKDRPRSSDKHNSPRKLNQCKSNLTKFSESCWRFVYYLCLFVYGILLLCKKPWFWDSNECWIGYPFQYVTNGIYWYYMIEIAFYMSLMFSQFMDVKRKDFWQMFVHHICTLLLLSLSWIDNMVRIGTLVLVIHDAVDILIEAAKMANYCKKEKLCNSLFITFTIVWFITRLLLFPYRIIYPALSIAHLNMDTFFAAYFLYNGLLILLLFLHVFWFIVILNIAIKSVRRGKVEKDERSSSEYDSNDEKDEKIVQ